MKQYAKVRSERGGPWTAVLHTALIAMLALPARAVFGQCCGDCGGDGQVTVDELVRAVDRALTGCADDGVCDASVATCAAQVTQCQEDLAVCRSRPGGQTFPATGQTTSYGTGDDGDVEAGAALSYTDNGDGTITDNNTGLMWEKKDDNNEGSIHDWNNTYTWTSGVTAFDGTVVSVLLDRLNNYCDDDEATQCTANVDCAGATNTYASNDLCGHAGHRDWRLANVKELQSIVDYASANPAVNPVFNSNCAAGCTATNHLGAECSCTQSDVYWSSTTYTNFPTLAWFVYFVNGFVDGGNKASLDYVRAVRTGF